VKYNKRLGRIKQIAVNFLPLQNLPKRQVFPHFSSRVRPPVQLHFKRLSEGEEGVTGSLSRHDLHRFGSSFEFLVKPFNDIGGSQGDPFFFWAVEEDKAGIQAFSQAFDLRVGKDLRCSVTPRWFLSSFPNKSASKCL
jgi:hypothetical protein